MRQRILIISALLELYALLLANLQALGGVRTDEAKYLLNIPYPHPPLLRWIIHSTEFIPFQEMLWRVLLASLLAQSVWFVWDMARDHHLPDRMLACGAWLLSTGVLLQAGSIVLAPVTAVEALVLLWLASRRDLLERFGGWIAVFWLTSLFTAYQAVLYTPLVWRLLRSKERIACIIGVPILLLALYALSNPISLASFLVHDPSGALLLSQRAWDFARDWMLGGSLLISAVGTWGILRSRDRSLLAAFLLTTLYVLFARREYNAVLFTPLFVAGVASLCAERHHPHSFPLLACFAAAAGILTSLSPPSRVPGPARATMRAIATKQKTGDLMIAGSFGHEWEFESAVPVRHYAPHHLAEAQAVVCLSPCDPPLDSIEWKRLPTAPVEAWVRK